MVENKSFPLHLVELINFLARIYLTGRLGGLSHLNIYIEQGSFAFSFSCCNCLLISNSEWRLNLSQIFPGTSHFYKACSVLDLIRLWDSMKDQIEEKGTEYSVQNMKIEVIKWLNREQEEI